MEQAEVIRINEKNNSFGGYGSYYIEVELECKDCKYNKGDRIPFYIDSNIDFTKIEVKTDANTTAIRQSQKTVRKKEDKKIVGDMTIRLKEKAKNITARWVKNNAKFEIDNETKEIKIAEPVIGVLHIEYDIDVQEYVLMTENASSGEVNILAFALISNEYVTGSTSVSLNIDNKIVEVVSIRIVDFESMSPVEDASVTIKDGSGNILAAGTTDADGIFEVGSIRQGTYRVYIDKAGYNMGCDEIGQFRKYYTLQV